MSISSVKKKKKKKTVESFIGADGRPVDKWVQFIYR